MNNNDIKDRVFKGVGVSPGIVIGEIFTIDRFRINIPKRKIKQEDIPFEKERFIHAVEKAKEQLIAIKNNIINKKEQKHSFIIDVHIMILDDSAFFNGILDMITRERINAEWALDIVTKKIVADFDNIEDPYLRERKSDIKYISNRVLRNLIGKKDSPLSKTNGKVVIVAHDLSPADTIQLNLNNVAGFVTDIGGKTSHTSILARSLGIPAVVGLGKISRMVEDGEQIIIDGNRGVVILNPSQQLYNRYLSLQQHFYYLEKRILKLSHLPAETLDGHRFLIEANIEFVDEVPSILDHGAEGVGLFRTEYIYIAKDHLPTEEEHFQIYKNLVEQVYPKRATIRTLDIGGDKLIFNNEASNEKNPALGLRAIRLCLKEKEIFKTQLRAIYRASAYGNLRIMIPMISGLEEILEIKAIMQEIRDELTDKKIPFKDNLPVGIMIEVPSASIIADILAKHVDFFSIGTNDLIQYTLAIDRINELVSYLYDPLHPSVLRLIKNIVNAAHSRNIEVGLCGEMASEPIYTLVLLGLGIDSLSMNPIAIPKIKRIIRRSTFREAKRLLDIVFKCNNAKEAEEIIRKEMIKRFPDII
ncbi:MAG: phosphoenolpyruvate--protein phosphotransferase [Deltaproteobacteria bacterium]|nr:phosphoenolpyruvate--protein phosphotransferase [Deltaproteobacteria bacterium]